MSGLARSISPFGAMSLMPRKLADAAISPAAALLKKKKPKKVGTVPIDTTLG